MALRSIYSQLLYGGELYNNNESGETSSRKELPTKIENDQKTQYCFRNLKPIQKERNLFKFNPNSPSDTADLKKYDAKLLGNVAVVANSPVEVPFNFDINRIENEGRYIVSMFVPENEKDVWYSQLGCDNTLSMQVPMTGTYWIVLKKYSNAEKKIYYDTSSYQVRQPAIILVSGIIASRQRWVTFTTNGNIYWYDFKGETSQTHKSNFACNNLRDFLPISNRMHTTYYSDNSLFNIHKNDGTRNKLNRSIISETQDGFWKQTTQNFSIELRINIEGWAIMGGTFGNWLTDSGFKTVEEKYQYYRDGKQINAITVTTPYPTKKAGDTPQYIGPIYFNGQAMVLSSGDFLTVWYTEDDWVLANSIYAKDFFTDLDFQFEVTANPGEIIVRQNKPGSLGYIENWPGMAKLKYVAGGFGQVDTTSYTGLAVYFRFQVINPKYPEEFIIHVQKTDPFYNAFASIGHLPHLDEGDHVDVYGNGTLVHQGYMSVYPRKNFKFNATVTYTALLPSDPDYTTGGWEYEETITRDLFDSINELTSIINDMTAANNISDIVGGVMTFLNIATSFPQVFEGIVDVTKNIFKKMKNIAKSSKVKFKRLVFNKKLKINGKEVRVTTPTFFNSVIENIRLTDFRNMLNDDEIFTVLHNVAIKAKKSKVEKIPFNKAVLDKVEIDPYLTSRIALSTPPVIAKVEAVPFTVFEAISESLPEISKASLIEFNQIDNTISILSQDFKSIKKFSHQPELIDYYIQNLGSNYTRSLFSLNLRKQLSKYAHKSIKQNPTYKDILDLMLNDRELINVNGGLSKEIIEQLYNELINVINNALL